jgi:hypothetical protein
MPKPATKTTEVIADPKRDRRQRRRFTPEYKARILAEVDACASRGDVGAERVNDVGPRASRYL